MDFSRRLKETCGRKGSLLCVGIDPRVDFKGGDPYAALVDDARRLIEASHPYVAVYKPNIAFFERAGHRGMEALETIIGAIPEDCLVLLDAKRGDIGPTAEAYAEAAFDSLGADAITLNPYMGRDAADPFLKREGKGCFFLCRTSNPRAARFQELELAKSGEPLFMEVARECASWGPQAGLVVAGNDIASLERVRAVVASTWILAPGIGAQGGDAASACAAGLDAEGFGLLPVVVRAVAQADDIAAAAKDFRDQIERARDAKAKGKASTPKGNASVSFDLKERVMEGLVSTGCFKTGEFVLKSGKKSPFYIDLRRVISDPAVLDAVAQAYASMVAGLRYDRIAGIPLAALPIATAVSLKNGKPLIYPRMSVKDHGTGNKVEGEWKPGEDALLVDDLITTGLSKLEAAEILRAEGIKVSKLAVLIERGAQGRKDMEQAGIELHAFLQVGELFEHCERKGLITAEDRKRMEDFSANG